MTKSNFGGFLDAITGSKSEEKGPAPVAVELSDQVMARLEKGPASVSELVEEVEAVVSTSAMIEALDKLKNYLLIEAYVDATSGQQRFRLMPEGEKTVTVFNRRR